MAKLKRRKQYGVCTFCGKEGEVTDEHIFPESWYPDDTPKNEPKWIAPSCYECNHVKYAPKEARIFPFLAMTAEPDHPGAKGIGQRGFRAADETQGKNDRDKAARARVRELMRERMQIVKPHEVAEGADYLGWRHQNNELLTTYVKEEDILPVIGKIARGVMYLVAGKRVDERYSVHPFRELSKVPSKFKDRKSDYSTSCGPGIVVDIAFFQPHLEPPAGFLQMKVWDTHIWYVAIIPKPELREELLKPSFTESLKSESGE
ncbi:MAG: HNH endonuclease [Acidobacteria bacterium]|nr:HNH endonuclease [Acidobacteriota bacterium]